MNIKEIDELFLDILFDRHERLGKEESGSQNYYERRFLRKRLFENFDEQLLEYIVSSFSPSTRFVECGVGFGQFSACLAFLGYEVTGFEMDNKRFGGANELREILITKHGMQPEKLRFVNGPYPASLSDGDLSTTGKNVLVTCNVVNSYWDKHFDDLIDSIKHFDHALLDLHYFGRHRDREEQTRLMTQIRQAVNYETAQVLFTDGERVAMRIDKKTTRSTNALQNGLCESENVQHVSKQRVERVQRSQRSDSRKNSSFFRSVVTDRLAEILRQREIKRVRYVHCDHFEPWRHPNDKRQKILEAFADGQRTYDYAQKASLFYSPNIPHGLVNSHYCNHVPGDGIGFRDLSEEETVTTREGFECVLEKTRNEVQLHVHHEVYTRGGMESSQGSDVTEWINSHGTPELDAQRFELLLQLSLGAIERDTGRKLREWAFVHGCWALNASDPEVCRITNEIEILMRHGCVADFSFPAGRRHCNPSIPEPTLCRAVDAEKGYDDKRADALPMSSSQANFTSDRFLIWNSRLLHPLCSLDVYADAVRPEFMDPEQLVTQWLRDSFALEGTLYIKTHGHSMNSPKLDLDAPSFWYEERLIQSVFSFLDRAASSADADIEMVTVSELIQEFRNIATG